MFQHHSDTSLEVTVHSAHDLPDVERFGKNDAYAQITLDLKHDKAFQKTFVHKNSGESATWNQSLVLKDFKPEHNMLYVEIFDQEATADEPIVFTTIPLNQVTQQPQGMLSAKFGMYTIKGSPKGEISLSIRVLRPGQEPGGMVAYDGAGGRGQSMLDEEHQKRMKKLKLKESAADMAQGATFAGAMGMAAGLLSNMGKKDEGAASQDATRGGQM
ncbi:hypothetical protein BGZ51_007446 [Haplosporangium sp. Z 767]|nr:hypothetical protein BGZ50_007525 [Haplosporangium sp. Z 11]KAF9178820.1 hypothetical protein BGZ51_007446 [Haplosporangium sp. Z 767]